MKNIRLNKPAQAGKSDEVQRRHVRIRPPATVRSGKKTFSLVDLSAGGFSMHKACNKDLAGEKQDVKLLFQFESFIFHLSAKAARVHHNPKKNIAGFRFCDMSKRQIALLDYIITSYHDGLLISVDDRIVTAGRH